MIRRFRRAWKRLLVDIRSQQALEEMERSRRATVARARYQQAQAYRRMEAKRSILDGCV